MTPSSDEIGARHGSEAVELFVRPFDEALQRGLDPAIDDHLPPGGPLRTAVLVELIHTDLEYRIRGGQVVHLEQYLERYPSLVSDVGAVVGLIAAEFELRRRRSGPTVEEYLRRFPEYRAELVLALPAAQLPIDPVPPAKGVDGGTSRLGRFELLEELGAGACGIVYRARDTLTQRTVAVKVLHRGAPRTGSAFFARPAARRPCVTPASCHSTKPARRPASAISSTS